MINKQLNPLCNIIGGGGNPAQPPAPTPAPTPPPTAGPSCPIANSSDWTEFEQNCYKYFEIEKTRKSAEDYCLNEQVSTIYNFNKHSKINKAFCLISVVFARLTWFLFILTRKICSSTAWWVLVPLRTWESSGLVPRNWVVPVRIIAGLGLTNPSGNMFTGGVESRAIRKLPFMNCAWKWFSQRLGMIAGVALDNILFAKKQSKQRGQQKPPTALPLNHHPLR